MSYKNAETPDFSGVSGECIHFGHSTWLRGRDLPSPQNRFCGGSFAFDRLGRRTKRLPPDRGRFCGNALAAPQSGPRAIWRAEPCSSRNPSSFWTGTGKLSGQPFISLGKWCGAGTPLCLPCVSGAKPRFRTRKRKNSPSDWTSCFWMSCVTNLDTRWK